MVTFFHDWPLPLRLALLSAVGLVLGGQINRGIYGLAWNQRPISPWARPPRGVGRRNWADRMPLVGWLGLRREAPVHGRAFWVRPMLIEAFAGVGLAALYWFEVVNAGLWPGGTLAAPPALAGLYEQFLVHVLLIALMAVATFIDFDEQTIPDEIAVSGTVIGLLLAVIIPTAALPTLCEPEPGFATTHHLVVTSSANAPVWRDGLGGPFSWPVALDQWRGLGLALAGVWIWCLAIMHKTWTLRRGLLKAIQFAVASIIRGKTWLIPLALASVLSLIIGLTWNAGGLRWEALFTAVAGLSFGGGLIWGVRIIGGHALGVEAMGFGDVTLMAMIGSFLGWQPAFLIFFMAPFSALLIAVVQWAVTGDRHIAFGPYLCLSTLILMLGWDRIWTHWARDMFALGWFIPAILVCCLILMGGLLWLWRLFRQAVYGF